MKYFSTFTGIGGLDVGLEEMGAECAGFSEIRESSIRIYERHYPTHQNFGDITKIDPAALPDFDVLTGGFPCQSFSLAGYRKGFKDKRGTMIFYLADILTEKQPSFAVLENVRGIVSHNGGSTLRNVVNLLAKCGYFVRVVLFNACHHGSAQNRERVLFLCSRKDFEKKIPEMTDPSKRYRDFRMEPESPDFVPDGYIMDNTIQKFTAFPVEGSTPFKQGGFFYEICGGHDRVGCLLTGPGGGGPNKNHAKIVMTPRGEWRFLSPIEGERLQGFPDDWTALEETKDRWFAIGNAVNCNVSRYLFHEYLGGVWW
jgi:DNA (cytosine-5)-methyltransferase 1